MSGLAPSSSGAERGRRKREDLESPAFQPLPAVPPYALTPQVLRLSQQPRHGGASLSECGGMSVSSVSCSLGPCPPPCSLPTSSEWGSNGKDGFQAVSWSPGGSRHAGPGVWGQGEASATTPVS